MRSERRAEAFSHAQHDDQRGFTPNAIPAIRDRRNGRKGRRCAAGRAGRLGVIAQADSGFERQFRRANRLRKEAYAILSTYIEYERCWWFRVHGRRGLGMDEIGRAACRSGSPTDDARQGASAGHEGLLVGRRGNLEWWPCFQVPGRPPAAAPFDLAGGESSNRSDTPDRSVWFVNRVNLSLQPNEPCLGRSPPRRSPR